MDDELTAISSSNGINVGDGDGDVSVPDNYREIFDKAFPSYLAMGMTHDEFYKKDHTLVIAYRKAEKLKRERENEKLWLQGAYVYQAICRSAPLFNPFNKNPKIEPYLDKPFQLYETDDERENAGSDAVTDKGLAYMQAQMIKVNKKFGMG